MFPLSFTFKYATIIYRRIENLMEISLKKLATLWKEIIGRAGNGKGVSVWRRKSESGGRILRK